MTPLDHINIFIGGILLALSIVLFMIPIPHQPDWRKFRAGRSSLAAAYLLLGILMIVNGAMGAENTISSGMITLIVAYFQALLYTQTCVLFVKPRSLNNQRYHTLLIASSIYSALLAGTYILFPPAFCWIFGIGIGLYTLLLIYCSSIFRKHYNEALQHIEYVYDEDMHYSIQWVKCCFYSALLVGVMVLGMIICYKSVIINFIGIIIYTLYYLSIIGYFMRYVNKYNFILRSDQKNQTPVTPDTPVTIVTPDTLSTPKVTLPERLTQWTAEHKYRDSEKTIDDIVRELHTTRSELNEYMMNTYGMNFRTWRNHLRIKEAQHLLLTTDIPVAELYDAVGYTDRSNFHRQFTALIGCTPAQFRTQKSQPSQ